VPTFIRNLPAGADAKGYQILVVGCGACARYSRRGRVPFFALVRYRALTGAVIAAGNLRPRL
jgi:hypothetical protein